jgi:hypothetical protein
MITLEEPKQEIEEFQEINQSDQLTTVQNASKVLF